jgi:hypothetical protein
MEFRAVLEDSGVNRGFIVSKRGFQSGALDAAKNTPIVLADFDELIRLFWEPWLIAMSARLHRLCERLFPFFDIYWFERLPELDAPRLQQFDLLRAKYRLLFSPGTRTYQRTGQLPISLAIGARNPEIIETFRAAGIQTYRAFFDVLLSMAAKAIEEFSSLFGIEPATLEP